MGALPQELIEEILSRLPVKSLLRFKRASKKWYSLISEDHKFHLKQSSSSSSSASKNLIIYHIDWNGDRPVFRYSDIDTCESRKIIFPVGIVESFYLIGSANGLICLGLGSERHKLRCFIWNPCTGKFKHISVATDSSSRQNGFGYSRLFGFGYDSISDDYKILGYRDSQVLMFSLKTNSWKILDFSVQCPWLRRAFFYSNGALHWYDTDTLHIIAFDLATEKISFTELPKEMTLLNWKYTLLPMFGYQGSLCTSNGESIWVMTEYGNAKSWAKFKTSLPKNSVPNGISRHGEVVYCSNAGLGFVKSDIQGRIADEDKSQMQHGINVFVYNESLISPKYFDPQRPGLG